MFEEFLFENEDVWLTEDDDFSTSGTFLRKEQLDKLKKITDRNEQIFVHAGVDEDIPEEEVAWCTWGTPEYVLTGKFPPTKGHFYKDVIAGHVAASTVANDPDFKGIYWDGASHFYIDGSTTRTNKLLCLAYDEKEKKYYEFTEDGIFRKIGNYLM